MRTTLHSLTVLSVFMFAGVLVAQDRAQPRDRDKEKGGPPAEAPPPRTAPEARQPNPNPPARPPVQAQPDAQRRRPRPDGTVTPRQQPSQPDARSRHPRPDPNHAYRERQYRWNYFQHQWWHGGDNYFLFPRRYLGPRWRVLYRGFYLTPHSRLPYDDGWFYWPYEDRPRGCDWYWVPTRRMLVVYDDEFGPHFRYWRWRRIYLCID